MDRPKFASDQWQREMPNLDLLPMRVIARLGAVTRLINREYLAPFFHEHGLHQGEFDVLATLRRSGAPYALGPTQLFEALMISSGGMTNRLDRLERAGLIERTPNPSDRRGTLVALTEAGRQEIDRLFPQHVENESEALQSLSRDEQEMLDSLLGKLLRGL